MNVRRLGPYLVLGVLVLGAGLGIGLGLTEAPVPNVAHPLIAKRVIRVIVICAGAMNSCVNESDRGAEGPRVVTVPDVVGEGVQVAMSDLVVLGLKAVSAVSGSPGVTVVSQKPIGGSKVARGSTVNVILSSGLLD